MISSPTAISIRATPTPDERRVRDGERAQQEAPGGAVGKAVQLRADVGRRARMKEAGMADSSGFRRRRT